MKKVFFSLMVAVLALTACAPPTGVATTQPSSSNQVATVVAATMQALQSNPTAEVTPESHAELLPHALYYLGHGGYLYRMERDGKTVTQMTNEDNVTDFDISPVDGSVVYVAYNQLILINPDGSNRRVLVDGGSDRYENDPRFYKDPLSNPVFSPDGQTIAYNHRHKGVTLYDVALGVSTVVIADDMYVGHSPVSFSPDGTKLLVALGQWENPPAHAVYYPGTNDLVRIANVPDGIGCCSEHGGPVWSPDSSSFYGVASYFQVCCQNGELWKVDAGNGAVTRSFVTFLEGDGTVDLPVEIHSAPDGQLYFFFGTYHRDSGFQDAQVLNMVRSAPDGVTDRAVLRDENFIMMNEALWAPDASFVIVATAPSRDWNQGGGVLELYYTDRQKEAVWLAPYGGQMKWGP